MNPREDNLTEARIDQSPGFLQHVVNGFGTEPRPDVRNDAVTAERVTAVLDLEKCPRPTAELRRPLCIHGRFPARWGSPSTLLRTVSLWNGCPTGPLA